MKKDKLEDKINDYWVCIKSGEYLHPIKSCENMKDVFDFYKSKEYNPKFNYYTLKVLGKYDN